MLNRSSRAWALAMLILIPMAAVADPAVSTPSLTEEGEPDELLNESFESPFPELPWRTSHPEDAAGVEWGRSSYRASDGDHSIYCAAVGPEAPGDGGPAPAGTASWTIVGPFDLSETTAGTLTFDLWLKTEQNYDVFMWLVSVDGQTFNGRARSNNTNGWETITADLANWGAAGDVIGEPEVWIAFVYQSDRNNLFEGAYVDRVNLTVDVGTPASEGRTYTTDADFGEGTMVGLQSTSDRLELTDEWDTLPYLWIPNSATGTVSKIDSESGFELGRYATGPNDEVDPGVAAVDLEGSCWVGNRGAGTVVKIGLLENGGCADRDGDGVIETSTDVNGDENISGDELLDWGEDECVLIESVLVDGSEATYVPGEEHEAYAANNLQAVAVDAVGNVWVGVRDSNYLYLLDGEDGEVLDQVDVTDDATYPTAAVVDSSGTLWVSSWPDLWVLGLDPESGEKERLGLSHGSKGLSIDRGDTLFVTGYEHLAFSRVETETGVIVGPIPASPLANGIATTETGQVWIAAAGDGTVRRYTPQGVQTAQIGIPGATGLAFDQNGKLWVAGTDTDTIYRIDPILIGSDAQKELVGSGGHDATGDFTGIVARNLTSRFGTWTVDHDSEIAGTPWGKITWVADSPEGTFISVRVRSSEDQENWSAWETVASGLEFSSTDPGRYLQIQASLQLVSGDSMPELNELTVAPSSIIFAPTAGFDWTPPSPSVDQPVSFQDTSTGDPTSWLWDFGDELTSEVQNPTHSFAAEGSYEVSLTATNEFGSDTDTQTVVVGEASGCTVTCSATAPGAVDLGEEVSFGATASTQACTGSVAYLWSFGDGETSDDQNPTHTYSSIGTLRWSMSASADDAVCTRSGDITVSGSGPDECTHTYWVPAVSRANGSQGSVWRSDLGLLGADASGASVELRLHLGDSTPTRVVTVASNAMVNLVDVVGWIDPTIEDSAALEICSDGELVVDSRTYNVLAADHDCFPRGTFGQHLAGEPSGSGLAALESGWLGSLRESAEFRTNLGFVNTGVAVATVVVDLLDAMGGVLVSFTLELEPGQWHQENRVFSVRADRQDLDAASARVSVVIGDGVVVYGSVIDNRTNDATTIPMNR